MAHLIIGIALFFLLHLIPYFGIALKAAIIGKIGKLAYRGLFALATLSSFVLIVLGWQAANPAEWLYNAPAWGRHATMLFVYVGIVLFIASNAPTNIRRALRHPQLLGLIIWGIGHLLANGETRSVILFGGLTLYGIVAIWGSNKRDGAWVKRGKVSVINDIITVFIGTGVYGLLLNFHKYFTGIAILP